MSRIKAPNLIKKLESRHCPLAALVEKYILLIAASVCGITDFLSHFQCVCGTLSDGFHLLPVSSMVAVNAVLNNFHSNCAISSFSKAYVCLAMRSLADYLLLSVVMSPDKADATVNHKLSKTQKKIVTSVCEI